MRLARSPVALLDAAYRPAADERSWVRGLVDVAVEVFGAERGAVGFVLSGARSSATGLLSVSAVTSVDVRSRQALPPRATQLIQLPEAVQEDLWFSGKLVRTIVGDEVVPRPRDVAAWNWAESVQDVFGFVGQDGDTCSFALATPLPFVTRLSPRETRIWTRIATHVGAGFRLHRARGVARLETADAVLTPTGHVEHLSPEVSRRGESFREGILRRQRARRYSHEVEPLLDAWRGLHDGSWSLVDHVDTDGRAFLLAVKNTPGTGRIEPLTARERAAVALAALGHPNKQIAYALGLGTPAVAMLLTRARRKLGQQSRVDLVRAFRRA